MDNELHPKQITGPSIRLKEPGLSQEENIVKLTLGLVVLRMCVVLP
jgi:hypothetical protein